MKKLLTIALPFGWLVLVPPRAMAHAGGAVPADVWSHWNVDPVLLISLSVPTLLYVRGAMGYRMAWWRTVAFMSAITALFVALISPLEAVSSSLFSAHMVQHLLLMMVAAPLLVWSRPLAPLLRGWPRAWRKGVGNLAHQPAVQRVWVKMTGAMTVLVVHVLALWSWHIPALYNAALADEFVHIVEHASFFITAALYWWMIVNSDMRGGRVLAVFLVMMASGLLGALMTFAAVPWYASHAPFVGAWGLTALEDQQLAGLTMWIPAGILYVGVAAVLLGTWLNSLEASMSKRHRNLNHRANTSANHTMHKGLSDA